MNDEGESPRVIALDQETGAQETSISSPGAYRVLPLKKTWEYNTTSPAMKGSVEANNGSYQPPLRKSDASPTTQKDVELEKLKKMASSKSDSLVEGSWKPENGSLADGRAEERRKYSEIGEIGVKAPKVQMLPEHQRSGQDIRAHTVYVGRDTEFVEPIKRESNDERGGGHQSSSSTGPHLSPETTALKSPAEEGVTPTSKRKERIAFQIQGRDRPGVSYAMISCLSKYEANGGLQIVDVSQIATMGFLTELFIVDIAEDQKYELHKDLLYTCQETVTNPEEYQEPMSLQWSFIQSSEPARRLSDAAMHKQRVRIQVIIMDSELKPNLIEGITMIVGGHSGNIIDLNQKEAVDLCYDRHKRGSQKAQSLTLNVEMPSINRRASKELLLELNEFCFENRAEVVIRPYSPLTLAKPKNKSLVVFGLSQVLITTDVLDGMLLEWANLPNTTLKHEELEKLKSPDSSQEVTNIIEAKLALLRGAPAEAIIKNTRNKLQFTKNCRGVCRALKLLGYKLALITASTPMPIAAYIKQELDLDYALAHDLEVDENMLLTGKMLSRGQRQITTRHMSCPSSPRRTKGTVAGTLAAAAANTTPSGGTTPRKNTTNMFASQRSSIPPLKGDIIDPMRKVDLMQLLADKAKIETDGIIVVGNYVHPDYLFEHGGTRVHFNSDTCNDFRLILYLFGIKNSEARQLMRAQEFRQFASSPRNQYSSADVISGEFTSNFDNDDPASPLYGSGSSKSSKAKIYDVRFTGKDQISLLGSIMAPLSKEDYRGLVTLSGFNTHAVHIGSQGAMVLVFQIRDETPNQMALKDFLFETQLRGNMPTFTQHNSNERTHSSVSEFGVSERASLIVSIIRKPNLQCSDLLPILKVLSDQFVNIEALINLDSTEPMSALEIRVSGEEDEPGDLLLSLQNAMWRLSQDIEADIAVQNDDVFRFSRRIIVFDMDSTLIQQEVIDELARYADIGDKVSEITEAAMRGEIDFAESLRQRVLLLKGHNAEELFQKVQENLIFTPGAKRLCGTLKKIGFSMAVISGGFLPIARYVQKVLGLDYAFANELEVDEHGILVGKTIGPVVTPQRKQMLMGMIAEVEECTLEQVTAVGDGANDIPMLQTAGLGVAFCAKPRVQSQARYRINNKDLSTVAFLLGIQASELVDD